MQIPFFSYEKYIMILLKCNIYFPEKARFEMIIGIDVGGTHTDGVLIKGGQVKKTTKVLTNHSALELSIFMVLDNLLENEDVQLIKKIVFSTTLTTNLISQAKYPPTGLIMIPGPGLSVDWLKMATKNWILSGRVDHRGKISSNLIPSELDSLIQDLQASGISDLAIISKFSTRNPQLEAKVKSWIENRLPKIDNIQLGANITDSLNFPRRVQTSWLNTAVHREYAKFLHNVIKAVRRRGITADLYLLKADGGTMPLVHGLNWGVETIKSGPAASIMGFLALARKEKGRILLLDVGGTTTDIAMIIDGIPLFEPTGVEISGFTTSIRGLLNRSIPYGGDSQIIVDQAGKVRLATDRVGPAVAFGGKYPTLTDALIVLGKFTKGDFAQAQKAFIQLLGPDDQMIKKALLEILDQFYHHITHSVTQLIEELANRPVYTISELLNEPQLTPEKVMMIGGPAEALLPGLAQKMGLTPLLPEFFAVANALGAAVARTTLKATLYADTSNRFYYLSGDLQKNSLKKRFSINDAKELLLNHIKTKIIRDDINDLLEITHQECFNVVRNYQTLGQIIKLEAQIKPGIDQEIANPKILIKGEKYNET